MKQTFTSALVLCIVLFTISACDAVDLVTRQESVGQPAVSVAQRQGSVLTPIGEISGAENQEIAAAQETMAISASPTGSATNTDDQETQNQQSTPTITNIPSSTISSSLISPSASPTSTNTPVPPESVTQPTSTLRPTNTRVPPTFTFTPTTAVEPSFTPTATIEVPADDGPTSCNPGGSSAFESEVVSLINLERANEGLPAFSNQSQLTSAARTHSDDMACNNFFSHTSPTTGSPFDRINAAGYSFSWAGENIAAGYGSPAAVVDGWMNSSGHRANILSENFTQIGIGYAKWAESDYVVYWTAVFASP